jgi:hypothetical protein
VEAPARLCRVRALVTNVTSANYPFYGTLRGVVRPYQSDDIDWDRGREGYDNLRARQVAVQKSARKSSGSLLSIAAQERIGSLIASAGTIWAVYVATQDYANLWRMQIMPPGPVEVCALGILLWLHAKWRRSTRVL